MIFVNIGLTIASFAALASFGLAGYQAWLLITQQNRTDDGDAGIIAAACFFAGVVCTIGILIAGFQT